MCFHLIACSRSVIWQQSRKNVTPDKATFIEAFPVGMVTLVEGVRSQSSRRAVREQQSSGTDWRDREWKRSSQKDARALEQRRRQTEAHHPGQAEILGQARGREIGWPQLRKSNSRRLFPG